MREDRGGWVTEQARRKEWDEGSSDGRRQGAGAPLAANMQGGRGGGWGVKMGEDERVGGTGKATLDFTLAASYK